MVREGVEDITELIAGLEIRLKNAESEVKSVGLVRKGVDSFGNGTERGLDLCMKYIRWFGGFGWSIHCQGHGARLIESLSA